MLAIYFSRKPCLQALIEIRTELAILNEEVLHIYLTNNSLIITWSPLFLQTCQCHLNGAEHQQRILYNNRQGIPKQETTDAAIDKGTPNRIKHSTIYQALDEGRDFGIKNELSECEPKFEEKPEGLGEKDPKALCYDHPSIDNKRTIPSLLEIPKFKLLGRKGSVINEPVFDDSLVLLDPCK